MCSPYKAYRSISAIKSQSRLLTTAYCVSCNHRKVETVVRDRNREGGGNLLAGAGGRGMSLDEGLFYDLLRSISVGWLVPRFVPGLVGVESADILV